MMQGAVEGLLLVCVVVAAPLVADASLLAALIRAGAYAQIRPTAVRWMRAALYISVGELAAAIVWGLLAPKAIPVVIVRAALAITALQLPVWLLAVIVDWRRMRDRPPS